MADAENQRREDTDQSNPGVPIEEDEVPYFRYSAALRIFGSIQDLDEITRELGLEPTHSHRFGERRTPAATPYRQDMWSYKIPVSENEPLHVHIDALWESLKSRKEYLLELKKRHAVDVFLGYRSNSDTAGFEIPYQSLEIFRELQVPLGVSVIIA